MNMLDSKYRQSELDSLPLHLCPAAVYNKSLSLDPLKGRPFGEHLFYWTEGLESV